jgi:hypothetical protein
VKDPMIVRLFVVAVILLLGVFFVACARLNRRLDDEDGRQGKGNA